MARKNLFFSLIVAVAFTACSDAIAPTSGDVETGLLGGLTETLSGNSSSADDGEFTALSFKRGVELSTYDTTFAAVQGVGGSYSITYGSGFLGLPRTFMTFVSPASAIFVDESGLPLPAGSPVPLSVSVDEDDVVLSFGPHGSEFLAIDPALLVVNLNAVNLGGRSPRDLKLYYQSGEGETWTALSTPVVVIGKLAVVSIFHFSNYALAF